MSPFSAVQVPWTTPPIIAGFLLNGWQGAVVQIINLAISTAIYFPFVRAQDKALLKEEQGEKERIIIKLFLRDCILERINLGRMY